jgi:hypothetical protein
MLAQEKNGLPGSDGPGGRMPSDGNRESEAHPTPTRNRATRGKTARTAGHPQRKKDEPQLMERF